ncbi:hypothetical protein CAPTEDRAFT_224098 [Capitella teleta]|uniref:Uncharacterized protein n=1 Tax=Capitella teleta TaxID=283909 RepID=R7UE74_CAPTE|nr:hypothetical protein CAPTEDRAFT_224098 [Capitella teleta]|eukprot:ELU01557.1 hypothetical protein CAPTEDRAFT_224098 [Capitella teleta]
MAGSTLGCMVHICVLLIISTVQADVNQEATLHKNLLQNYTKSIRPVGDPSKSLDVKFSIRLIAIDDMNEQTQILSSNLWLSMSWTDANLAWKPEDYGGLSETRIPMQDIWKPDIHLFNNADRSFEVAFDAMPLIYSSGLVMWIPQISVQSRCPFDMTKFPFDTQKCELKFGSWTYPENKLNMTLPSKEYKQEDLDDLFTQHGEFELLSVKQMRNSKKYDCCPEKYIDITYTLELKRRTEYSTHLILSPGIICSLLIPFIFLLPHQTSDKIIYGIGLLVANVFAFGEFEDIVPHVYPRVPSLGIYFIMNLALTGLAIVFTIAFMGVWNKSNTNGQVPGFLRTLFLGVFGRLCCVKRDDYMMVVASDGFKADTGDQSQSFENIDDQQRMVSQASRLRSSAEWRQLACVLDRLFFLLFLAVVIIAAVSVQ